MRNLDRVYTDGIIVDDWNAGNYVLDNILKGCFVEISEAETCVCIVAIVNVSPRPKGACVPGACV